MLLRHFNFCLTIFCVPFSCFAGECNGLQEKSLVLQDIYAPKNVCKWMADEFASSSECIGDYLSVARTAQWEIAASSIRDMKDGFLEVEVSIAGPGGELSGEFPRGYERLTFQILVFFSPECEEIHYLYVRLAQAHPRSVDEIAAGDRNTIDFNTTEGWSGGLKKRVDSAIARGVSAVLEKMKVN